MYSNLYMILIIVTPPPLVNAVCHIVKNYLARVLNTKVPLILGMNQTANEFSHSLSKTLNKLK